MAKKKYTCPTCSEEQERAEFKKNICMHCGQTVKFIRKKAGGGSNKFHYVCVRSDLDSQEPAKPVVAEEIIDDVAIGEGVLLTNEGDVPEVWLVEESEDDPPKYMVIYRNMINTGWLYCPHCETRMFKNIVLNSGGHAEEYMCSACKSKVTFVFYSPGVLRLR
jgi:ssDNA-binding Zn-finger/Zn-ribbon topoisomerase 1